MGQSIYTIFHSPSGKYLNLVDIGNDLHGDTELELYLCQCGYKIIDPTDGSDAGKIYTRNTASNIYTQVEHYNCDQYAISDLPDTGKILTALDLEYFFGSLLNSCFLYASCDLLANPILLYTALRYIPERSKYTLGYSFMTTDHSSWEDIAWTDVSAYFYPAQNLPEADSILELFMLVKDKLYFNTGLFSDEAAKLYNVNKHGITALTEFVIAEYAIQQSKTY